MLVGQEVISIYTSRLASLTSVHTPVRAVVDFSSKQSRVYVTILGVKMLLLTWFLMKAQSGTVCSVVIYLYIGKKVG